MASVFDGQNVLLWGGRGSFTADGVCGDGARFNVAAKTWTPLSTQGALSARTQHSAVWTGERMIIWGGIGCGDAQQNPPIYCDKGAAFDPVHGKWAPVSTKGVPSPRIGHSAVWTGSKMVIWGGTSPNCGSGGGVCSDGAAYDPLTDTWAPLRAEGALSARSGHVGLWTGNALFIWGGMGAGGANGPLSDGASGRRECATVAAPVSNPVPLRAMTCLELHPRVSTSPRTRARKRIPTHESPPYSRILGSKQEGTP